MKNTLQKQIKNILKEIKHSKIIIASFAIAIGVLSGLFAFQSDFQANLSSNISAPVLLEFELENMFTDLHNIKEVEITHISQNEFFVEFFATETGDSLHPYSFIVEKNGDTLISIQEIINN